MLNNYDISRLKSKFENWCYTHKVSSDIFDFESEIDRNITYWENWSIIEPKLKVLASSGDLLLNQVKQNRSDNEKEKYIRNELVDLNLFKLFNEPKVIGIVGDIHEAKSNLLYHLITLLRNKYEFKVFSYGLRADLGEQKIFSVEELEKVKNSILIVDEFINLYDVEDRKKRKIIETSLRLVYHNNNILILSGTPENYKKFISAKINIVFFKKSTLADFINGSRFKNICVNYSGIEMGSSVLDLEKHESIVFDGEHYSKIHVPYYAEYDSKSKNVQILVSKNVQKM